MDKRVEHAYLQQMRVDVASGFGALERLARIHSSAASAYEQIATVTEVVRAAGAISRMFWPYPYNGKDAVKQAKAARASARADHLKAVFGIDNTSPFKSLEMRHNVEHMDERLDAWADEVDYGYNVMQFQQAVNGSGGRAAGVLFCLDPSTGILHFREDAFDLKTIAMALGDLDQKLRSRAGAVGRF